MKTLVFMIMVVFLVGCNIHRGYMKPNTTYQDFYSDLKMCGNTARFGHRNACMQANGWEITRNSKAFRY